MLKFTKFWFCNKLFRISGFQLSLIFIVLVIDFIHRKIFRGKIKIHYFPIVEFEIDEFVTSLGIIRLYLSHLTTNLNLVLN